MEEAVLKEIENLEKNGIVIKHVFFDCGDDYEKLTEYVSRSNINMKCSDYLRSKKVHLDRTCQDVNISPWTRCVITKILCDHYGAENFEFVGRNKNRYSLFSSLYL